MDITTVLGLLLGIVFIALSMGKGLAAFYDLPSIMITFGGTIAATIISFPMDDLKSFAKIMRVAFFHKKKSIPDLITMMTRYALKARREGILALESEIENSDDEFLTKSLQIAIDGTSPEMMEDMLMTELAYLEKRHQTGQDIVKTMANLGPAFGLIGTLIGLILMLGNLNDPKSIGPGMAVALITTFYGAILANLICIPLANKLKAKTKEELLRKEVIIAGILAIQSGDNPRIVEQKLSNFLPPNLRKLASVTEQEGKMQHV